MKKIILVFSILVSFLFSFSNKIEIINEEQGRITLLNNNDQSCNLSDSIVNITTINNLINVSGFIMHVDDEFVYIATSYNHYNKGYSYEVVFSDYSRKRASVLGYAVYDEILFLKVDRDNKKYCKATLSRSEYIDVLETVNIIGMTEYKLSKVTTSINSVGICKNCNEDTYKKYYYSLLNANISNNLIGAGVFDQKNQLLGIITNRLDKFNFGLSMLDVNKIVAICYNLINEGKYNKNYIKYNLLDVNSLTNYEKYLYSLDEELTSGVLVSSIHYLNYIIGGLNQGMVILSVNNISVNNCYEFDNELSKYRKGTTVYIEAKTITGSYKTYRIKL